MQNFNSSFLYTNSEYSESFRVNFASKKARHSTVFSFFLRFFYCADSCPANSLGSRYCTSESGIKHAIKNKKPLKKLPTFYKRDLSLNYCSVFLPHTLRKYPLFTGSKVKGKEKELPHEIRKSKPVKFLCTKRRKKKDLASMSVNGPKTGGRRK